MSDMTREEKESRVRALAVNRIDQKDRMDRLGELLRKETDHSKRQELAADIASAELAYFEANDEYQDILYPGWRERMRWRP